MMDKRKLDGAVDESSAEYHESDVDTCPVKNLKPYT